MRLVGIALIAAWTALAVPSAAQDNPVVVELFTSQGCSSCPPADALLAELADRDDVLALAFHVDYWDYIGWADEFADPAHTARQKAYAQAKGERSVYTPQMIVGGSDFIVGFKPMKLADLIQRHKALAAGAKLEARRRGDQLEIQLSDARRPAPMVIYVAVITDQRTVAIRRGENAGRTLDYHNIVSGLTRVGEWNGQGTFRTTVQLATDDPVAVLVQERGHGPIVAAARLP